VANGRNRFAVEFSMATIVQVAAGQSPEDAALSEGGTLVDPGPYDSYEEANDALDQFEELEDDQGMLS
jgi:hypothetical protein